MKEEKKQFSNLEPETREMLMMKYYSGLFQSIYFSNEAWKEEKRKFLEEQEKRFKASRERKQYYSKGKYWY